VKVKARVRLRSSALTSLRRFLLVVLVSGPALAEGANPIDGNYRQSALREDVTVSQWQDSCGPAPKSQSSGGGETVSVRTEGDEIVLVGGNRVYRSNECYESLPGLARDAHSRDPSGKSWRTRCSSPKNDPRRAVLQTSITVSDGRIDLYETGKYEVTVSDGHCTADIKRMRSYAVIAKEAAPPSATATATATILPTETPTRMLGCQNPGPAAKLEVTPARKLVRPGDTFQIRARILDASGCAVPGAGEPSWALSESMGVHIDMHGKVRIDDTASSGTTEVVVSAHSKRAVVLIETTTPEKYEELLKIGGLNAEGESTLGSSITLEGKEEREVQAIDQGRTRRLWFGGVIGALSLALIGLYLVLARRAKRQAEALKTAALERYKEDMHAAEAAQHSQQEVHLAQMNAHLASVAARDAKVKAQKDKTAGAATEVPLLSHAIASSRKLTCPVCSKDFAPPFQHCPNDGAKLVDETAAADTSGHAFCPICARGFSSNIRVCPDHREELVPVLPKANMLNAIASERKAKICPTCGERSAGVSAFCGRDGTPLVLVN
jgi:hypothetical protein